MARRRPRGAVEGIAEFVSILPWWAGILLAVGSYFGLHHIASSPIEVASVPSASGTTLASAVINGLAAVGQYALPLLFVAAAIASTWRRTAKLKQIGIAGAPLSDTNDDLSRRPRRQVRNPAIQCPQCGASMVRRSARRGSLTDSYFWGCPDYPECRGTRTYP